MASIKRNIIFSLENRKKNGVLITDNVPIRMRVIYLGNRVDFSTGYRTDISKWNNQKQKVRNGCFNKLKQSSSYINTDLLKYQTQIQDLFKLYETQNLIPTPKILRNDFNSINKPSLKKEVNQKKLIDTFDKFTKECGTQNDWTISTFEKFKSIRNHLINFNSQLTFKDFDIDGLNKYVLYLRDKKEMRNSTIGKQVSFLKWFLRWANQKGYNDYKDFETFKPKLKTTPKKVIFLTIEELEKLSKYEIPEQKQYLERVRDVFLFCCYSSIRYSDVYNLKRSNIKEDHIEIVTIKTGDSLFIDLNKYTRAILDKYKDVHFENNKVLPVISNQKMNDYIKELAKLAKINEPITEVFYKGNERIEITKPKHQLLGTHAGRRTFICFALSLNIPIQIIMKWTGHSNYKSMKPYIDVADNIKANAMNKFNL